MRAACVPSCNRRHTLAGCKYRFSTSVCVCARAQPLLTRMRRAGVDACPLTRRRRRRRSLRSSGGRAAFGSRRVRRESRMCVRHSRDRIIYISARVVCLCVVRARVLISSTSNVRPGPGRSAPQSSAIDVAVVWLLSYVHNYVEYIYIHTHLKRGDP